jgi:O-antigen ligase
MSPKKAALTLTIAALLIIPLICSRQIYCYFDLPKTIVLYVAAAALLILYLRGGHAARAGSPLGRYLGCYFLWLTVAALISPHRLEAFFGGYGRYEGLFFLIASGFFFFIGAWLREFKKQLVLAMILTGAAVGLVATVEFWTGFGPDWQRSSSTYGNPMILGTYFALVIPVAAGYLFAVEKPWLRRVSLFCLYLMALGNVFSYSRGGWGGAALAVMIWAAFCLPKLRERRRTSLWLVLVVILAVGSGALMLKHHPNPQRLQQMAAQMAVDPARQALITAAFKVFKGHPWLGVGLNGLTTAITRYLPVKLVQGSPTLNYDMVHNDLVHTLVTQGVIGFLVYLGLLFVLGCNCRKWCQSGVRSELDSAIWAAVIGHLAVIQFSFPWVGYTYLFWLLVGLVNPGGAGAVAPEKSVGRRQSLKLAGAGILLAAALGYGLLAYYADYQFCRGFLTQADPRQSKKYLATAVKYAPWEEQYRFARAQNALAIMNQAATSSAEIRRLAGVFTVEMSALLRQNMDNFRYYLLLGDLFAFYGKSVKAAEYYTTALKLYPNYYPAQVTLGSLMLRCGRFDRAEAYFKQALRVKSDYPAALDQMKLLAKLRGGAKR